MATNVTTNNKDEMYLATQYEGALRNHNRYCVSTTVDRSLYELSPE
jgi:hypothetical protein